MQRTRCPLEESNLTSFRANGKTVLFKTLPTRCTVPCALFYSMPLLDSHKESRSRNVHPLVFSAACTFALEPLFLLCLSKSSRHQLFASCSVSWRTSRATRLSLQAQFVTRTRLIDCERTSETAGKNLRYIFSRNENTLTRCHDIRARSPSLGTSFQFVHNRSLRTLLSLVRYYPRGHTSRA